MKKGKIALKDLQRRRKLSNVALQLRLVDLIFNFERNWLIELCDNNLASELVENRSFFKPITIEEIVIFMISQWIENKIPFVHCIE